MKKYIFGLMIGTALWTIDSAWAMDEEDILKENVNEGNLIEGRTREKVNEGGQSSLETGQDILEFEGEDIFGEGNCNERKSITLHPSPPIYLPDPKVGNISPKKPTYVGKKFHIEMDNFNGKTIYDIIYEKEARPVEDVQTDSRFCWQTANSKNLLAQYLFDYKIAQGNLHRYIEDLNVRTDIINALIGVFRKDGYYRYGFYVTLDLNKVFSQLSSDKTERVLLEKYTVGIKKKPERQKWKLEFINPVTYIGSYRKEGSNAFNDGNNKKKENNDGNNKKEENVDFFINETLRGILAESYEFPPPHEFITSYGKLDFLKKVKSSPKSRVVERYLNKQSTEVTTLKKELEKAVNDYNYILRTYYTDFQEYENSEKSLTEIYNRIDQFWALYDQGIPKKEPVVVWDLNSQKLEHNIATYNPVYITSLTIQAESIPYVQSWKKVMDRLRELKSLTDLSINLPIGVSAESMESLFPIQPKLQTLKVGNAFKSIATLLNKKSTRPYVTELKELSLRTLTIDDGESYIGSIADLISSPYLSLTTINLSGDKNVALYFVKLIGILLRSEETILERLDVSNTGMSSDRLKPSKNDLRFFSGPPIQRSLVLNLNGNNLKKEEKRTSGFIKAFNAAFPNGGVEVEFIKGDFSTFVQKEFPEHSLLSSDLDHPIILDSDQEEKEDD
jgi:predicted PolB exonuclease-like 3'-5' exonuclease